MNKKRTLFLTSIFFVNVFALSAQDEAIIVSDEIDTSIVEEKASNGDQHVNQLGGHIGFVHGLITISKGNTSNIADSGNYAIGFPIGVTIKTCDKFAFDIEFVPFIDEFNNVLDVFLFT